MTTAETYSKIIESGSPALQLIFIAAGAALGGSKIVGEAKHWDVTLRQRSIIFFCAIYGALLGSALPAFFAGDVIQLRAYAQAIGPKTMLGGLLGSFFAVAAYKKLFRVKAETADSFTLGAILTLAVGRIGCHFGHCCYGKASSFGFDYGDGVVRIPTQLVEAALLFILYFIFVSIRRAGYLRGRQLFLFFILYGLIRFGLEFLREPVARTAWGIGYYQWLALFLFATGIFQMVKRAEVLHLKRVST